MKVLRMSVITTIALVSAACGGTPQCQEPRPYEQARLGEPIRVPEGLDPLDPGREMTIPEPSPRREGSDNGRCLEYPPTFGSGEAQPASAQETESTAPEPTQ